jgi:hypothetical protein
LSITGQLLIVMGGESDNIIEQHKQFIADLSSPQLTVEYRAVPDINITNEFSPRFGLNWIKLNSWSMTEFDTIINLDTGACDMASIAWPGSHLPLSLLGDRTASNGDQCSSSSHWVRVPCTRTISKSSSMSSTWGTGQCCCCKLELELVFLSQKHNICATSGTAVAAAAAMHCVPTATVCCRHVSAG